MAIRRLQAKQWKTVLDQKADTENIVVLKGLDCETKQEGHEDDRVLQFTISSSRIDRDNDTLAVDGWQLDNFQKTGPVLWAHDGSKPPIATATRTWVENSLLKSTAKFLPSDLADHDHVKFADMVYQMYRKGYMRSLSVGFKPIKYLVNEERGGWYPLDYVEQELLEYSAVPVPSNVDALYEARSAGIDLGPMKMWAESVLDKDPVSGMWIPKNVAEELRQALDTSFSVSTPKGTDEDTAVPQPVEEDTVAAEPSNKNSPDASTADPTADEVSGDPVPLTFEEKINQYDESLKEADEAFATIVADVTKAVVSIATVMKAGRALPSDVKEAYLEAITSTPIEPEQKPEPIVELDFSDYIKSKGEEDQPSTPIDIEQEARKTFGAVAKAAADQAIMSLTGRLP